VSRQIWDYVFTTGASVPTIDDITAGCVAKAFGQEAFHPQPGSERIRC